MGDGKSGSGSGAHDYFGTIAGLACAGPVEELVAIVNDGKTIWPQATRGEWATAVAYLIGDIVQHLNRFWECITAHTSGSPSAPGTGAQWKEHVLSRFDAGVGNPAIIPVPGYGTAIFYWGTSDQTLDPVSVPKFASDHPPYRHQAFMILKDWLFGRERTSAPNIEVVVRRVANQDVIVGDPALLDSEGQANPLPILAEAITNPIFGLGQDLSLLDAPSWQAVADALTVDPAMTHLSPVLTNGETLSALAGNLMPYFDGWIRWSRAGTIEAGRFAHDTAPAAFDEDSTVDQHGLIEELQLEPEVWGETVSEINVRFSDRDRAWKESSAKVPSPFNREVTGEPKVQNLDRPWITRSKQAAKYAAESLRMYEEPGLSGTAVVRAPRFSAILPGSLFLLKHELNGTQFVCRCIEKSDDGPGEDRASIRFEIERALAPAPYQPPLSDPISSTQPAPEVVSLFRLVSFNDGSDIRLLLMAARKEANTTWVRIHLRQADGTLFYELGRQASWHVAGDLQQAYPNTNPVDDASEDLRVTLDALTVPSDLERIQATQTADAINDNALLLWVFNASGAFEIITVKEMRMAVGETFYRFKVRRARFGTARLSFSTADKVFIGYRSDLVFYSHSSFRGYADAATVATFRLQPRNIWREAELSDTTACPDRTHTFGSQFASLTQLGTVAGYYATSATSLSIGTGTKTFTTQAGLAYVVGTRVRITSTGTAGTWMEGSLTAYSGTSMTVSVDRTAGTGSHSDWALSLAGEVGSSSATTWDTLTDGATITWTADASRTSQQAKVTLAGNRTLAISGAADGMTFRLRVTQDGTGGRTLTLPAGSKVAGGGAGVVTLSAAAGKVDLLEGYFDGTNYWWTIDLNYT